MDVNKLFDQRVKDLGDWRGEALSSLRKIVDEAAPDSELTWKWDSPVWTQNGLLLSLGSFSDHVKIHFFKGASIPDKEGVFNAGLEAKATRGVDIFEGENIDKTSLKKLISEAVTLNTK